MFCEVAWEITGNIEYVKSWIREEPKKLMIDLSICIVSYNTKDLLKKCLESIYGETKNISFEIFVIDNASIDDTVEMVKKNFNNVNLIINKKNLGFAIANNQAIKDSKGRYILLLNPDTIILNSSLDKLVKFMDSHPKAGVVGPQILNPDRTLQFSYDDGISLKIFFNIFISNNFLPLMKILLTPFREIKHYFIKSQDMKPKLKIKEVGRVRGCCLLVRQEAIKQIGLMDEQFFMYCEEVDWEYRIKNSGWKICFYPLAQIVHYWGASTSPDKKLFKLIQWQSNYKYIKKHYGSYAVLLTRIMAFMNAVFKTFNILVKKILNKLDKEEFLYQLIFNWEIVWLNPNKKLGKKY